MSASNDLLGLMAPSCLAYCVDIQEFTIDWPLFNGRIKEDGQSQQKATDGTLDNEPQGCGITPAPRCEESPTECKCAKHGACRTNPAIPAQMRFLVSQCTHEPAHHLCPITVSLGHEL